MSQNKRKRGTIVPDIAIVTLFILVLISLFVSVMIVTSTAKYRPPISYIKVSDTLSGHTLARSVECDQKGRSYVSYGEGERLRVLDDNGNLVMCTKVK